MLSQVKGSQLPLEAVIKRSGLDIGILGRISLQPSFTKVRKTWFSFDESAPLHRFLARLRNFFGRALVDAATAPPPKPKKFRFCRKSSDWTTGFSRKPKQQFVRFFVPHYGSWFNGWDAIWRKVARLLALGYSLGYGSFSVEGIINLA